MCVTAERESGRARRPITPFGTEQIPAYQTNKNIVSPFSRKPQVFIFYFVLFAYGRLNSPSTKFPHCARPTPNVSGHNDSSRSIYANQDPTRFIAGYRRTCLMPTCPYVFGAAALPQDHRRRSSKRKSGQRRQAEEEAA